MTPEWFLWYNKMLQKDSTSKEIRTWVRLDSFRVVTHASTGHLYSCPRHSISCFLSPFSIRQQRLNDDNIAHFIIKTVILCIKITNWEIIWFSKGHSCLLVRRHARDYRNQYWVGVRKILTYGYAQWRFQNERLDLCCYTRHFGNNAGYMTHSGHMSLTSIQVIPYIRGTKKSPSVNVAFCGDPWSCQSCDYWNNLLFSLSRVVSLQLYLV